MLTLGIESSCDDTSASVLRDGTIIESNIIASQHDIHSIYGGVVPELACRRHIENIGVVVSEALDKAAVSIEDIDLVCVTQGPGLVVALLVGLSYAKGLAYGMGLPLVGVNHLEGHILSVFLEKRDINFPYMALLVSGGHTEIYLVKNFGEYSLLGQTRDDAAGEALDKGAKLLGFSYPGGPEIEKAANMGDPNSISFPRSYLDKGSFDFSFSGVKTSLRNYLQKTSSPPAEKELFDIAASYQEAVFDVLVKKVIDAANEKNVKTIVIAGGVAANKTLRQKLSEKALAEGIETSFPTPKLCTDNAAMIALAGYHKFIKQPEKYRDFAKLDADPVM
jgi:N6-L-threonylcarbamoyladenine synthase